METPIHAPDASSIAARDQHTPRRPATSSRSADDSTGRLPHCLRPCRNCPWRRDSPAGEFPVERYAALRATTGQPGNEAGLHAPMFACHKSPNGRDRACAGWLAVAGSNHLGIRLAAALGRLPGTALQPDQDWPDLFDSFDEMAQRKWAGPHRPRERPPTPQQLIPTDTATTGHPDPIFSTHAARHRERT